MVQEISQKDVAKRAGVSDSLLRKWREGTRIPKLPEVEKVLNAIGWGLVPKKHTPFRSSPRQLKLRVLDVVRDYEITHIAEIIRELYPSNPDNTWAYLELNRALTALKKEGKVDGPFMNGGRKKYWKIQKAHDR